MSDWTCANCGKADFTSQWTTICKECETKSNNAVNPYQSPQSSPQCESSICNIAMAVFSWTIAWQLITCLGIPLYMFFNPNSNIPHQFHWFPAILQVVIMVSLFVGIYSHRSEQ